MQRCSDHWRRPPPEYGGERGRSLYIVVLLACEVARTYGMWLKVLGLKFVRVEGVKPERPHPYSQKEAGREDGFSFSEPSAFNRRGARR